MNTFAESIVLSGFQTLDFIILTVYVILIVSLGIFVSRDRKKETSAKDYFLASNTLTWWVVGASLIAANISTEHFIGMSGTSFANGIAIAAYEVMAAIILIVIGKFFLPTMIKRKTKTIQQFLSERYNNGVGLAFSILWLFIYVFINLTSVAWLGALAIEQIFGLHGVAIHIGTLDISLRLFIVFALFVVAGSYTTYGGLLAVAWTDVLQCALFIGGGFITSWVVLQQIGNIFDQSAFGMLGKMYTDLTTGDNLLNDHFHLIIQQSHDPQAFSNVPGIAAVFGGILLTNIGYWGCNQYIIQKGLAAKDVQEGQKGMLFAAFLKLLIPFFVLLPGLCAYYLVELHPDIIAALRIDEGLAKSDNAYPWLIHNFTPTGIEGLAFVTLIAAIISTLSSLINSTATIFTVDIYKKYINPTASDLRLVNVGRIASLCALLVALIATTPLLGSLDQAFQYIQEYSSFIYPGIVTVFGLGLFWKRASTQAATLTALLTIPLGVLFKVLLPEMPFHIRGSYIFIILFIIFVAVSQHNKNLCEASQLSENDVRKLKFWAVILGCTGAAIILITTVIEIWSIYAAPDSFIAYLHDIGIQAFFFFGVLVGGNAIWLWSDACDTKADIKALPIRLNLYQSSRNYTYGIIIIGAFSILLYILLW